MTAFELFTLSRHRLAFGLFLIVICIAVFSTDWVILRLFLPKGSVLQQEISVDSVEFQNELKNTEKFIEEVLEKYNFSLNSDMEIVRGIGFGLTRNQMIYGKRYCPCFFVTNTDEDRICPCTPALEEEIPNSGACHCQIFVDPNFKQDNKDIENVDKNSLENGLDLINQEQLSGKELEELLFLRESGKVKFRLVDVREMMEYKYMRIKGTDHLVPTTRFYNAIKEIAPYKDERIIIYCHVGSRSGYCQQIMWQMGFEKVSNLTYGIASFRGELERG